MIRTDVLGVGVDALTRQKAVESALCIIKEHRGAYMVTPNPEIVMAAWDDPKVFDAVNSADIVIADGVGVLMAAKILKRPLPERVTGIDVAADIMRELAKSSGSVFLLGAKAGVAEKAAANIERSFPGIVICGTNDGYTLTDELTERINAAEPDFLFVCLGVGRQELWMAQNAGKLRVGLMAGLGGTLDVLSGDTKRAPLGWQKRNLEWLYRCFEEPKRFKKIMKFPGFLLKAYRERAREKKNGKR